MGKSIWKLSSLNNYIQNDKKLAGKKQMMCVKQHSVASLLISIPMMSSRDSPHFCRLLFCRGRVLQTKL